MNIAEAKKHIEDAVDCYLETDETGAYLIAPEAQRPLFLLGAPGIGKTAIVGQVARDLGIGLVSYSMTHHTRQSALGLPFIVHRSFHGRDYDVSEYTMSEILASVYEYIEQTGHEQGILFLDEINCVSETLYPSMLQFLQFKTFGRHHVPSGWIVVCAGNPPAYNKSVYDFDVVTLDRLRKIEVEPDLDAWKAYALKSGVHPAVLTYLETKPEHFYSVESTPLGKSFVTARAWDDLSRTMKLYERKGKTVDKTLIDQFLQDAHIAERFAQYYLLFTKYRSDYQVAAILEGRAPDAIRERAACARFDERLALLRLILDALDARMSKALEQERLVAGLRDVLRAEKAPMCTGERGSGVLVEHADALMEEAAREEASKLAPAEELRGMRLLAARLAEYATACEAGSALAGPVAFATAQQLYGGDVAELRASAEAGSQALDEAFAFVESTFGAGREMSAFVAELTARPAIAQFLSLFGNEAYYAHNRGVLVADRQSELLQRMEALDLDAVVEAAEAAEARERATGCGGSC